MTVSYLNSRRASYLESTTLDTTVSQVRMDTAVEYNTNQGQAVLVEECRCPPGYIGLSCDVSITYNSFSLFGLLNEIV